MQDKYVGDVGDFGKYVLLNKIINKLGCINLGVNWYYVIKKENNGMDGRHIDYLNEDNKNAGKYRECFPALYNKLKIIVNNSRRIHEIENNQILPKGTIFYSKSLPQSTNGFSSLKEEREQWFERSLHELKNTQIIFLDPDNGIQTDNIRKTQSRSVKYAFIDEIERYFQNGKSLLIYNHRDHKPKMEYNKKISGLEYITDNIKVLRFKKISVIDYIFLIQKEHNDLFSQTINGLTKKPYNFMFELYEFHVEKRLQAL